jgi:hypothetical protein
MMLADFCNEIVKAKKWLPLMTLILERTELQNGIPYRDRELFVTSVIVVLIEQRASRMSRNLPPAVLLDAANALQTPIKSGL